MLVSINFIFIVSNLTSPLSQEEVEELDDFLISGATSDETMMISALDGYLTAIASAPIMINPSEWMPGIWGPAEEDMPEFETIEQAEHITGLIIRHSNEIINVLRECPENFGAILDENFYESRLYVDGEMWAYGYTQGIELCRSHWQFLFDDLDGQKALRPILLLGAPKPEEEMLTETPPQREDLSMQIPYSVVCIYDMWSPYREANRERIMATTIKRDHPKIGRNDPCLCGSGKKFKKCCGMAATLH